MASISCRCLCITKYSLRKPWTIVAFFPSLKYPKFATMRISRKWCQLSHKRLHSDGCLSFFPFSPITIYIWTGFFPTTTFFEDFVWKWGSPTQMFQCLQVTSYISFYLNGCRATGVLPTPDNQRSPSQTSQTCSCKCSVHIIHIIALDCIDSYRSFLQLIS